MRTIAVGLSGQKVTAAAVRRTLARGTRQAAARVTPLRSPRRPLWVLGGSSGREYCDNARALHEYLVEERPDVRTVWVIDRRSPDVPEVAQRSEWVDHRSVAAHRLVRAADVLAYSHGIHDLPGLLSNRSAVIARLGHGLTAFKRTRGRMPRRLQRTVNRVDLAPVASTFEQENKEAWGFPREKLPVTGLARWDLMRRLRQETDERDTVLFALTWREWMGPSSFRETPYWRTMTELADTRWFTSLLADAGLSTTLFVHPLIRETVVSGMASLPRPPQLITRGKEVPAALARSALVVTDYSSLAWDALHLGIPVAFLHFDLDDYLSRRSSFVDLRSRLFGPAVPTVGDLADTVAEFLGDGCRFPEYEEDARKWADLAFAHDDERNCERIVHSIDCLVSD